MLKIKCNNYKGIKIMEKLKNKYTVWCLILTTFGCLLSIQNPPFYLGIIILVVALAYGVIGYKKGKK